MAYDEDVRLAAALRQGDADAFAALVDRLSPAMIRVALAHVPSRAAAEEAVQETWIAVMRGIDRFEGRASLKTWIFRILANVAMRSGARERRSVPFSALAEAESADEPAVDPDRFLPADHAIFPGHWAVMPTRWPTPEDGLIAQARRAPSSRPRSRRFQPGSGP
jgi:RNA polymerase sigma-70 factor (ECF subfamily)